ncbi:hypothetical protein, partial [Klebsiella pneumoniae]|uniref:hypothetical protein n=1 Tax=Klebsiella pneumoniae TaxID=573 RepID=UPI000CC7DC62
MNLSLCRFLDTLPPIAVSREGDQSAYGQAGSLWFSLLRTCISGTQQKTTGRETLPASGLRGGAFV